MAKKTQPDLTPPDIYSDPSLIPVLFNLPVDGNMDDREYLQILLHEQETARRLNADFWYNEGVLMASTIVPVIRKVFFCSINSHVEWLASAFEIDIDFNLVSKAALEWIANYGFDLITRLNRTQEILTREALSAWVKEGEPLSALVDYLTPVYGRTRAEMIAVTEVTRAYGEANLITWQASGVVSGKEWHTAEDDLVCPICYPLDGQRVSLSGGSWNATGGFGIIGTPPAHVRCRCWMAPIVDEPKLLSAQLARKNRLADEQRERDKRAIEAVEVGDGN